MVDLGLSLVVLLGPSEGFNDLVSRLLLVVLKRNTEREGGGGLHFPLSSQLSHSLPDYVHALFPPIFEGGGNGLVSPYGVYRQGHVDNADVFSLLSMSCFSRTSLPFPCFSSRFCKMVFRA